MPELYITMDSCWAAEESQGNVAAMIGVLYVIRLLLSDGWSIISNIRAYLLAPLGISRTNLKKYGKWAVVTGASEGIGKGYAVEGLNVVIMSRSQEKLQSVADEIREKYHCEVHIIAVDFTEGQKIYPRIAAELKDLDIGILVNNVGRFYDYPEYLADVDEMCLRNVIELNCQAITQMSKIVLPIMIRNRGGFVVNLSSVLSTFPIALCSVYSASKAFINYFTEALYKEYNSRGIEIQLVTSATVATKMRGQGKGTGTLFEPSPATYSRAAVATIGIQKTTCGYFPHAIIGFIMNRMPESLMDRLLWKEMISGREEYLRSGKKQ